MTSNTLQEHETILTNVTPSKYFNWASHRLSLPPANIACEGYVFTGVCLSTGGCAWWGCAWQEACMVGGCAWQGACMAGGHAWQGTCMAGGMHGRGHACHTCPPCNTMRYGQSMHGQYTSYWNALLL